METPADYTEMGEILTGEDEVGEDEAGRDETGQITAIGDDDEPPGIGYEVGYESKEL